MIDNLTELDKFATSEPTLATFAAIAVSLLGGLAIGGAYASLLWYLFPI